MDMLLALPYAAYAAHHFKEKTKQNNDESATLVGIYYTRLQNMASSKCIHEWFNRTLPNSYAP